MSRPVFVLELSSSNNPKKDKDLENVRCDIDPSGLDPSKMSPYLELRWCSKEDVNVVKSGVSDKVRDVFFSHSFSIVEKETGDGSVAKNIVCTMSMSKDFPMKLIKSKTGDVLAKVQFTDENGKKKEVTLTRIVFDLDMSTVVPKIVSVVAHGTFTKNGETTNHTCVVPVPEDISFAAMALGGF